MEENRATIISTPGTYRYFDKNGVELADGDTIMYDGGHKEKLYRTTDGRLGTDATNPSWIASGRAMPCEYGIYPLEYGELKEIVKIEG